MPRNQPPEAQPLAAAPPSANATAAAVGIDWGTTNRRGFLLDASGGCLAVHADDEGMLQARGRFPASLRTLLKALGAAETRMPVLMAGMVGSANGWTEAPYVTTGEPLIDLRHRLHRFEADGRHLAIVPGCKLNQAGRVDVMRGEETQLLGALTLGHGDGWYLLPGTHSKWVRLEGGAIADFATFMTGELFALLSQYGTLAAAMTPPASPKAQGPDPSVIQGFDTHHGGRDTRQAFELGLQAAADGAMSNALFGCRARVVTGTLAPEAARDHLSGLLIGAEWHDIARHHGGQLPATVRALGAPALVERHAQAAAALGVTLTCIDAQEATVAGLARLLGLGTR